METNPGAQAPATVRIVPKGALTSHPNPLQLEDPLPPLSLLQGPAAAYGATGVSPWQPGLASLQVGLL